jgi:hypothetical protein
MTFDQWNNRSWSSFWKADEIGDRLQRQLVGDVHDEVPLGFLCRGCDDLAGSRRQTLLKLGHAARREEPRDQLAQPRVHRRVRIVHEDLGRLQLLGGHVVGIPHDTAVEIRRPRVGVT